MTPITCYFHPDVHLVLEFGKRFVEIKASEICHAHVISKLGSWVELINSALGCVHRMFRISISFDNASIYTNFRLTLLDRGKSNDQLSSES